MMCWLFFSVSPVLNADSSLYEHNRRGWWDRGHLARAPAVLEHQWIFSMLPALAFVSIPIDLRGSIGSEDVFSINTPDKRRFYKCFLWGMMTTLYHHFYALLIRDKWTCLIGRRSLHAVGDQLWFQLFLQRWHSTQSLVGGRRFCGFQIWIGAPLSLL